MIVFITLEIYRIHLPLIGYNITIYHVFIGLALFFGMLNILLNEGRIKINKNLKILLVVFIIFIIYSFLEFLRNIVSMHTESISLFLVEIVGYIMVLIVATFINYFYIFKKAILSFVLSGIFVYLGSFYHLFLWAVKGKYVTGIPFWYNFSHSVYVKSYLSSIKWFYGFPRFRLPFSSPAGTGIFLSISGIILLCLVLKDFNIKSKLKYALLLLNIINFLCLIGTFARASWAIYIVGNISVLYYFRKYKLISFGKILKIYLVSLILLFFIINIIPNRGIFTRGIIDRLNLKLTYKSDIGHLNSRLLALHYWLEKPFIGLGVGGFWLKPGGGIHAHSTYFTILVNRGLIGLFLFLTFIFLLYLVMKKAISIAKGKRDKTKMIYGISLLSSLIGLSIGHFLYQMNNEIVWLLYGLIFSYANIEFYDIDVYNNIELVR